MSKVKRKREKKQKRRVGQHLHSPYKEKGGQEQRQKFFEPISYQLANKNVENQKCSDGIQKRRQPDGEYGVAENERKKSNRPGGQRRVVKIAQRGMAGIIPIIGLLRGKRKNQSESEPDGK